MAEQVELSVLDLRYENYRLKNRVKEKALLASISENGINEPLQGIDTGEIKILLDGFKRYRCARKLSIGIVPYICLSADAVMGIIEFIRKSVAKGLSILEQAGLIDELTAVHKMSYSEIAIHLGKSKSWVAMRANLIGQMSEVVRKKIFSGQFPVYSFMYNLRPFIRMNGVRSQDVDEFVALVAGKGFSIRDIRLLCDGYFRGSEEFRQQMRGGDMAWSLKQLKEKELGNGDGCTEQERQFLKELEITKYYMNRMLYRSRDTRIYGRHFYSQANVLAGVILQKVDKFKIVVEDLHDRSGNPQSDFLPS